MLQWMNAKIKNRSRTAALRTVVFAAVFAFSFFILTPVLAQGETIDYQSQAAPNSEVRQGLATIEQPLGLPVTDIRVIVARIIRAALGLIGIVLLAIILYGGFLWMTSGGNEEQIGKAKKILVNAVIGLIIILCAYGIVLFVMRMLGIGEGEGGGGGGVYAGQQNFSGSGALGRVIKDHYPERGQTNVARNTKIAITFFKPIKPDSFIIDRNGNEIFGDCVNMGANMNWETDCDALDLNKIKIETVTETEGAAPVYTPISGAAVLAAYTADKNFDHNVVYTISIRPYAYLGSDVNPMKYQVYINNDLRFDDARNGNPQIFNASPVKYYSWTFATGLELDLSPPTVKAVYPDKDASEVKNTVIQVYFSEPMDPIGVQGQFNTVPGLDYYALDGQNIFLKSLDSSLPVGVFSLLNNYRTLEFTPSTVCGQNACGGDIYCLPVCDKSGCKSDRYDLLLKAGQTFNSQSFEAVPFSGLMDMAGNALDGDKDLKVDSAPTGQPVFDNWMRPDNYYWNFTLRDEMDLTPPYLLQSAPGPNAQWVVGDAPWTMRFSKIMRIDPLYQISIKESPTPSERCAQLKIPSNQCVLDEIWKAPRAELSTLPDYGQTHTFVAMSHGPFLDGLRQYYLPYLGSVLEDVHFNCFYPGQGPDNLNTDQGTKTSGFCGETGADCCLDPNDPTTNFCCNGEGLVGDEKGVGGSDNYSTCFGGLKSQ